MPMFFSFCRPRVVPSLALVCGFLFLGASGFLDEPARAGGSSVSHRASDLMVTIDSRWAGVQRGGYYPIRIRVTNAGPTCNLTFRFLPQEGEQIPTVERRDLQVEQDGTAGFTLSIPLVGRGSEGNLEIERDGVVLDQFTTRVRMSDVDYNPARPSFLVISPNVVGTQTIEYGIKTAVAGGEVAFSDDHQVLPPVMLPKSWVDYTGVDMVMISLKTLAELPADERAAILQWTQTGGTLVIYEVGEQPDSSPELKKLLNLADSGRWTPANPLLWRGVVSQLQSPNDGRPMSEIVGEEREPESSQWGARSDAFARHDYLLGRVYAFPENPFPGAPVDWAWWWANTPVESRTWEARNGVLPRRSNPDFFNFLIPGVTSVPIYAFLVLMTLFTIVIGPLNYVLLRRRKRMYLLLLTIPAIAFVTSLTLFVYSTLSYGFSVASRARSVTLLDQRTNTAVSLSRISLFAGMAPSDGLKFSPNTAVYPVWPATHLREGSKFESARTVWGEQQHLADGWLRSRTRTQFATVQHRTERGRLEVGAASDSRLSVSNGLEWDIEALVLVDGDGNIFEGDTLGAGNSGTLTKVAPHNLGKLGGVVNLLRQYPLELPEDLALDTQRDPFSRPFEPRSRRSLSQMQSGGMMESLIEAFKSINTKSSARDLEQILPRRSYLAVLADRPGIELGLEDTDERAGYHLLWGRY